MTRHEPYYMQLKRKAYKLDYDDLRLDNFSHAVDNPTFIGIRRTHRPTGLFVTGKLRPAYNPPTEARQILSRALIAELTQKVNAHSAKKPK